MSQRDPDAEECPLWVVAIWCPRTSPPAIWCHDDEETAKKHAKDQERKFAATKMGYRIRWGPVTFPPNNERKTKKRMRLPYQQRVIDEKAKLDERARKLSSFIGDSDLFAEMPQDQQELMKVQNDLMWQLSEVLEARIRAFPETSTEKKNNIMFDCAASIVTSKTFEELTVPELVEARRGRLGNIQRDNEAEAFGFCDRFQEEES